MIGKPQNTIIALAAGVFLLGGCIAVEDYERKVAEATTLRRQLEDARSEIGNYQRGTEKFRKEIDRMKTENEALGQSLTMARRYGQQLETKISDLRANSTTQAEDTKSAQQKVTILDRTLTENKKRIIVLEEKSVGLRKRLARFEDRLKLQEQVEKDLKATFKSEIASNAIGVHLAGEQLVIRLASNLLFASGKIDIQAKGKRLLDKVAVTLRRYNNREFQVHGHTDNVPISPRLEKVFESNWELSSGRATRVARYLVEAGNLNPKTVSAAGLGEFRPIADNKTPEGRQKNRRIEIIIFPPSELR
ncbi:MAG: OmpA family protein [bacterium]|nr:OmpA family protein [bacterium]